MALALTGLPDSLSAATYKCITKNKHPKFARSAASDYIISMILRRASRAPIYWLLQQLNDASFSGCDLRFATRRSGRPEAVRRNFGLLFLRQPAAAHQ